MSLADQEIGENVSNNALPFNGLKVLDCASFIAGPAAATILSDFGAQVVKIEPPEGDPYRELWHLPGSPAAARNYPWEVSARDKRSLALDLKHPQARDVLERLLKQADVFVTNLPLPVRDRLYIGHEDLLARHPRLIYASLTAYGEVGPEAEKTGFDATAYWARTGLMDLVRPDHESAPARSVAGMGDHPSATALYAAIVTALYRRERTGQGGLVHTSLMANGLWANAIQVQGQLSGVAYSPRQPRANAPNPLSNIYRCKDGRWLNLAVLNEAKQVPALAKALDCSALLNDARFNTTAARAQHKPELITMLDQRFEQYELAYWRNILDQAGITFSPIGTLADISTDVQMLAIGALIPFSNGSGLTVANPVNLDGVTKRPAGAAPGIGQHSREVLDEAGYSQPEIDAFCQAKVVFE